MVYLTSFRVTAALHLMHKSSESLLHPEFELVTSSPNYPQNNGCRNGKTQRKQAKQLMKKSKEAGTDFHLALLAWRNTTREGVGSSPVLGTRTLLPTTPSLLEPAVPTGVRDKPLKKKEIHTQYNWGAHELPPLHKGDMLRMLPNVRGTQRRFSPKCFKTLF